MQCGQNIRKRIPQGKEPINVECPNCDASYRLSDAGEGKALIKPKHQEVECANRECTKRIIVWEKEVHLGARWTCPECKGQNSIVFGIVHELSPDKAN